MKTTGLNVLALALVANGAAQAQETTDRLQEIDEVVVTGTRSIGRGAADLAVPVDVVSGEALAQTGYSDLSRALQFAAPSVNYNRAATTATAASTRPVTLRGLAPDQVLVLVNGKRRHASAILNVNNTIGRGSAPVDLNTIPASAIQRIEILRDGAAAQYGSDAIGGVVNIILRKDASGGYGALQGGITEEGDGANVTATGRQGFRLGEDGHLTLSGEVRHQEKTNRANVDQRFDRVTYWIGDPKVTDLNLAMDAALPAGPGELYAFGTLSHRDAKSPGGFRTPGYSPLYPDGFVPHIHPSILDFGITGGYRAVFENDWRFDLSHTAGYDDADFTVGNTVNVSLGADSPTRFDAGGVVYRQHTTDLTLSRHFGSVLSGLNIAAGAQHRLELYRIKSGEPAAYSGLGASGFPGFNPRNPVDEDRNAYAAFIDIELDLTDRFSIGGAGRYDHYGDFGGKATWKTSARLELTRWLALRGTASTGFRAPSMQQQYFSAVTNNLSQGELVAVGTLSVNDPIARVLGATDLKPETSRNFSVGGVLSLSENLSLSADWFHIEIDNRIALSEQLGGESVIDALAAAGITNFQQVRFFTNAIDTTTEGFEISGQYSTEINGRAGLSVGLGYGRYKTDLDRLASNATIPTLPLLGTKSLLLITKGQPQSKLTLDAALDYDPVTARVDVTRFGKYEGAPLINRQVFGAKTVIDVSASVALGGGSLFTAGVHNIGDVYPDTIADNALPIAIAATGGSFPTGDEAPFGFNGRSYFARIETRF